MLVSVIEARVVQSAFEGHQNGIHDHANVQFEKGKNAKTAVVFHDRHCTACLHHQTAFDQKKKKLEESSASHFHLNLSLFIYLFIGLKPALLSRRFVFTQPLQSNMIFYLFFAASYVNVTILLVCVKMNCLYENPRESCHFQWLYDSPPPPMKPVQNIICRWILPLRSTF